MANVKFDISSTRSITDLVKEILSFGPMSSFHADRHAWACCAGAGWMRREAGRPLLGEFIPFICLFRASAGAGHLSHGHRPETNTPTRLGPNSIGLSLSIFLLISLSSTSGLFQARSFTTAQVSLCVFLPVISLPIKLINRYS